MDPEDLDFGGHDQTKASVISSKGARDHYKDMFPAKKIPSDRELDGEKYAGKKVSRANLKLNEESVSEDNISVATKSDIEYNEKPRDHTLIDELKRLQVEEEEQIKLVATRAVDEVEKGKHVKNQYLLWDKVLDVRLQMQPLLNAVNRVPSSAEVLALDEAEDLKAAKVVASEKLAKLTDSLLELQIVPLKQDKMGSSGSFENQWKHYCALKKSLLPYCQDSREKWHQIILASETSTKKQLRVINQGIWQQVESAMSDRERLIRRTQVLRQSAKRIARPEDDDFEDEEGNKNVFPGIFDDTDFYQHLLREWIEVNPTRQVSSIDDVTIKNVSRGKAAASKVEQRASKGR